MAAAERFSFVPPLIQVKVVDVPVINNEFNFKGGDMQIDNHSLINEFPEHREKIHSLKISDRHFLKLSDDYHDVNKELERLEKEDSPATDEYMEQLKKKRLHLKDKIYSMLQGR